MASLPKRSKAGFIEEDVELGLDPKAIGVRPPPKQQQLGLPGGGADGNEGEKPPALNEVLPAGIKAKPASKAVKGIGDLPDLGAGTAGMFWVQSPYRDWVQEGGPRRIQVSAQDAKTLTQQGWSLEAGSTGVTDPAMLGELLGSLSSALTQTTASGGNATQVKGGKSTGDTITANVDGKEITGTADPTNPGNYLFQVGGNTWYYNPSRTDLPESDRWSVGSPLPSKTTGKQAGTGGKPSYVPPGFHWEDGKGLVRDESKQGAGAAAKVDIQGEYQKIGDIANDLKSGIISNEVWQLGQLSPPNPSVYTTRSDRPGVGVVQTTALIADPNDPLGALVPTKVWVSFDYGQGKFVKADGTLTDSPNEAAQDPGAGMLFEQAQDVYMQAQATYQQAVQNAGATAVTAAASLLTASLDRQAQMEQIIKSGDIQLTQLGIQQAFAEAQLGKQQEFTTQERLGQQAFETAQLGSQQTFQTQERLGGQAFAAGQQQKGQEFASGERAKTEEFQRKEREETQRFQESMTKAQQDFQGKQAAIDRQLQIRQLELESGFAYDDVEGRIAARREKASLERQRFELDKQAQMLNVLGLIGQYPQIRRLLGQPEIAQALGGVFGGGLDIAALLGSSGAVTPSQLPSAQSFNAMSPAEQEQALFDLSGKLGISPEAVLAQIARAAPGGGGRIAR